jgi:hypothetical protein
METEIPKKILDPILKEAASLAKTHPEQLVIVRAEAVVWNDGSLGCPEPGIEYTQALVNGYWVVISAAAQTYDFRVSRDGSFRLCPAGRGRPPLQSRDRWSIDWFRKTTKRLQGDWQTVPAGIKYWALVSFLASDSLGEVLFGNSHVQSAVA